MVKNELHKITNEALRDLVSHDDYLSLIDNEIDMNKLVDILEQNADEFIKSNIGLLLTLSLTDFETVKEIEREESVDAGKILEDENILDIMEQIGEC